MKHVLIICPYFPPNNAADMQRVRMSLPFFKKMGWVAEVVMADEKHSDMVKDPLLMESLPDEVTIHKVGALSLKLTRKLGVGNIAYRSYHFFRKKVNSLLSAKKFDLIYFSTTQFPLMVLGATWKKKFGIPYVLDFQDPWYSDYYDDKPATERPKNYKLAYAIHKYLEPIAVKNADGLISVSQDYIDTLHKRYPETKSKPSDVITFGVLEKDFEIAAAHKNNFTKAFEHEGQINLVYIGRGGYDLQPALHLLFSAFKAGLDRYPETFKKVRFHFLGTSYAPAGRGIPTIRPVADEIGVGEYVNEVTDRLAFYETLSHLQDADGLIIPGSESNAYNASKLYPYIFSKRPMLAIFPESGTPYKIVKDGHAGDILPLGASTEDALSVLVHYLSEVEQRILPQTDWAYFDQFTAEALTAKQVALFNRIINPANV